MGKPRCRASLYPPSAGLSTAQVREPWQREVSKAHMREPSRRAVARRELGEAMGDSRIYPMHDPADGPKGRLAGP